MDCTDAHREALMRDFAAKASPAPAPGQRQAAGDDLENAAGRPPRRGTNPGQRDGETRGGAAAGA
jgi:hypothetical protein